MDRRLLLSAELTRRNNTTTTDDPKEPSRLFSPGVSVLLQTSKLFGIGKRRFIRRQGTRFKLSKNLMIVAMKGLIFTEFLDFVATAHGDDMVDDVIDDCRLPNGGAYTSVGTYDYTEMQALIAALAQRTRAPAPEILRQYGRHLFHRFVELFPGFFESRACLFDFVESVEGYIHVEVHKLYPDAQFPSFKTHIRDGSRLEIDYRSCRPLAPLAEGLILGASDHFREPVSVDQRRHEDANGSFVRFAIRHLR